jgi:hypothetical protein
MLKKNFFVLSVVLAGLEFFVPQRIFASSSTVSDLIQEERIPVFFYQGGQFLPHSTRMRHHERKIIASKIEDYLAVVLTDVSKKKPLLIAVNQSMLLKRQDALFPSLEPFQAGIAETLAAKQGLRTTSYFQEESVKLYESYCGQNKFFATFLEASPTLSSEEASEFMDASSRFSFRLHKYVTEFSSEKPSALTLGMYLSFEATHPKIRQAQLRNNGKKFYHTLKIAKGESFTASFKRLSLQDSVSSEGQEAASVSTH